MKTNLLPRLICPRCKCSLELQDPTFDEEEVISGTLVCKENHKWLVRHGVPRFVNAEEYADTFSKQRLYVRKKFKYYEGCRSGDSRFEPSTGISLVSLPKKPILEVGCGYGRYLELVSRHGGQIIGVDLSTHSVELAFDYVGRRPGVNIVQADLYNMPFREGSFPNVFSLGVLHHTPSTKAALQHIARYASEGGRVSLWVYPKSMKKMTDLYRHITTRLPHDLLYYLCIINQALFSWIRGLPGGWRFNRIVPGAVPKKGVHFWQRVLNDFDNYSPQYAYSHDYDEVETWFNEIGIQQVECLDMPTAAVGLVHGTPLQCSPKTDARAI